MDYNTLQLGVFVGMSLVRWAKIIMNSFIDNWKQSLNCHTFLIHSFFVYLACMVKESHWEDAIANAVYFIIRSTISVSSSSSRRTSLHRSASMMATCRVWHNHSSSPLYLIQIHSQFSVCFADCLLARCSLAVSAWMFTSGTATTSTTCWSSASIQGSTRCVIVLKALCFMWEFEQNPIVLNQSIFVTNPDITSALISSYAVIFDPINADYRTAPTYVELFQLFGYLMVAWSTCVLLFIFSPHFHSYSSIASAYLHKSGVCTYIWPRSISL